MERPLHFLTVILRQLGGIWRKASIETVFLEEEWRYRRGLKSEAVKMEELRKAIEGLKRQLARIVESSPWASEVAVELLGERLLSIREQGRHRSSRDDAPATMAREERSA